MYEPSTLAFAVICVALALAVYRITADPGLALYLRLGQTIHSLTELSNRGPSNAVLLATSALSHKVRVDHAPGPFQRGGRLIDGAAAYVPVPSGYVAQLGYVCAWNGSRFLDRSAFCLSTGHETSSDVTLIPRSQAGRLVFDHRLANERGSEPMRSRADEQQVIDCEVAFHCRIPDDADDAALSELFDNLPNVEQSLSDLTRATLERSFRAAGIAEILHGIPELVDEVNARFRSAGATAGKTVLAGSAWLYGHCLEVQVSAIAIKPRWEHELAINTSMIATHKSVDREIDKCQERLEHEIKRLEQDYEQVLEKLQNHLEAFSRQRPKQPAVTANEAVKQLVHPGGQGELVDRVGGVFAMQPDLVPGQDADELRLPGHRVEPSRNAIAALHRHLKDTLRESGLDADRCGELLGQVNDIDRMLDGLTDPVVRENGELGGDLARLLESIGDFRTLVQEVTELERGRFAALEPSDSDALQEQQR